MKDSEILYRSESRYQTINLIQQKSGILFELNGSPQVHTREEGLYHEMTATLPGMLAAKLQKVLILGGGDGLAARDLLRFKEIESITLVELDSEVLRICTDSSEWRDVSCSSLSDPRVHVVCEDAFAWLDNSEEKFDLIIHDIEISATDQPQKISIEQNIQFIQCLMAHLEPEGLWVMTVSDDAEDLQLIDGAFQAVAEQASPAERQILEDIQEPFDKLKACLQTISPYVSYWKNDFPILGSHAMFISGNGPLDTLHRWPDPKPRFINDDVFLKLD